MLKLVFLAMLISGCAAKQVPEQPKLIYFGIYSKIKRPGFYGIDPATDLPSYLSFTDPSMSGGQCLTPAQFSVQQQYIMQLKTVILGE